MDERAMKRITLHCVHCDKVKDFHGATTEEIIKAIDKAGWVDGPGQDYCPKCWAETDDSYLGESD